MPLMGQPTKPSASEETELKKKTDAINKIVTPISHPEESQRAFLEEVIDTHHLPTNALLTHIEGSDWTVNYSSQVLSQGSEANPQSLSQDPVHQQYSLIVGLEIKVTSALEQAQNTEDGTFTVTGTATTLPGLVPMSGDMFTADVGDGRVGVFTLTSSRRMSMMRDTVHEIEYIMTDYLTAGVEDDLSSKVVETRHFNMDYLLNGEDPFLDTVDFNLEGQLKESYYRMISWYVQLFYSREYKTLLVPDSQGVLTSTYDPNVLKLFHLIISRNDLGHGPYPTIKQVGGDVETDTLTLWDALVKRDPDILRFAATHSRRVLASDFSIQPFFSSIAVTNIKHVIWPASELTHKEKRGGVNRNDLLAAIPESTVLNYGSPDTVMLREPDIDSFYVFSKPFYEGDAEQMSQLEYMVDQYLDGDALNLSDIKDIIDALYDATPLQQFYYVPVMLVLIKVFVRNL